MNKIYILDTNVLLHDPKSLFSFGDNEVVIPLVVLDELDKKKVGNDTVAQNARIVIRSLDSLRAAGNIRDGVKTESNGLIRVEISHNDCPDGMDTKRVDNKIIGLVQWINSVNPNSGTVLVTKDLSLRVKCDALGLCVEDYNSEAVVRDLSGMYSGNRELFVPGSVIDELYSFKKVEYFVPEKLYTNEYLNLIDETNPQHSALARFNGSAFEKLNNCGGAWGIAPRNREQKYLLDALFNPNIQLVTVSGRAGTGKSLLSLMSGVAQVLDSRLYKKVVITRPIQSVGSEIGFLPGDINSKMEPWMIPMNDALDVIFPDKGNYVDVLKSNGQIEIAPLSFVRGRNFAESFMILDECQNLSRHEVKTMITRCAKNTKIILNGDVEQIDVERLDYATNGLSCVIERFKNAGIAAHITLTKGERSELATLASELL